MRTPERAPRLSILGQGTPNLVASGKLEIDTTGEGFADITADAQSFVSRAGARDGSLHLFLRHTSASLLIQENADPDVRTDLRTALRRLAPENAGWVHTTEGPDDMPAHVKAMLTGPSLQVPVIDGRLALGTWQGIYLVEHRTRPHRREVILQFLGTGRDSDGR
ncbi:MAG: secondary thiamine-phosphate synthase enzyme YjbQ [Pseudorhodoplanes sp.]